MCRGPSNFPVRLSVCLCVRVCIQLVPVPFTNCSRVTSDPFLRYTRRKTTICKRARTTLRTKNLAESTAIAPGSRYRKLDIFAKFSLSRIKNFAESTAIAPGSRYPMSSIFWKNHPPGSIIWRKPLQYRPVRGI